MATKSKEPEKPQESGTDIFEFSELINCILDYYSFGNNDELSETWKRGTDYENKVIPPEIDELVKSAFIKNLKKFTD